MTKIYQDFRVKMVAKIGCLEKYFYKTTCTFLASKGWQFQEKEFQKVVKELSL